MPWRLLLEPVLRFIFRRRPAEATLPAHLERGRLGERAAHQFLRQQGLRFLTANYRSGRGEIDLVFRDGPSLVFVEVKTRSSEKWSRPASAVNRAKQRRIARAALDFLRESRHPRVAFRFDIVEVVLDDGRVCRIRHLPDAFRMPAAYRYG